MTSPDEAERILRSINVGFAPEDIQGGRQFRLNDGGIVCVYITGTVTPRGKDTLDRRRAIEALGAGVPAAPTGLTIEPAVATGPASLANKKVFIVYGHDQNARNQLELVLHRLDLEPVVLMNVPSGGQTIIEKLEANADVTYACVLLTPDDQGHRAEHPEETQYRERQNVVLELGMFLSGLGRTRVAILYKGELELPSDIQGLVYLPFSDEVSEVTPRLAAELQEAGFHIDIKRVIS